MVECIEEKQILLPETARPAFAICKMNSPSVEVAVNVNVELRFSHSVQAKK